MKNYKGMTINFFILGVEVPGLRFVIWELDWTLRGSGELAAFRCLAQSTTLAYAKAVRRTTNDKHLNLFNNF